MPYINQRWLGGTLTNWKTIRDRIDTLKKLEKRRDNGEFELLSKKEALILNRKIEKLAAAAGRYPQHAQAARPADHRRYQARSDGGQGSQHARYSGAGAGGYQQQSRTIIDYIIPANDDAVRAIKLLLSALADAVAEGEQMRKAEDFNEERRRS